MLFACHAQVNDGQHHKDECLQRDYKNVEIAQGTDNAH
jgi:hypothetical protein